MIPGLPSDEDHPLQAPRVAASMLIVDGSMTIRRNLLDILHRVGFDAQRVSAASSMDEAMERFARDHPSLVFAEFVGASPEDGLQMMLEMLALAPHTKVIVMTAEPSTSPIVRAAVRAGVFAVLEKPLRHEKVRQIISEIEMEDGGLVRFR